MASIFYCTGQCGNPVAGEHWTSIVGAAPISQADIARFGGRALRYTPVNSLGYSSLDITGNVAPCRFYLYFGSLPTKDAAILRYSTVSGSAPGIIYRSATQDICAAIGNVITGATPVPVVTGKWYRIESLANISASPWTMTWAVAQDNNLDAAAAAKGVASDARSASTFTEARIGAAAFTTPSADVILYGIKFGNTIGDYPFGPGAGIGLQLIGDGTHGFNNSGDFKRNNSIPIDPTEFNVYSELLGLLDPSVLSRITIAAAAAGEYVELNLGGMPNATSVACMEFVTMHGGISAAANKQTLRYGEAGTFVDLHTDRSVPSGPTILSKHIRTRPGGLALTSAAINAFSLRYGSSWTSVLAGGELYGLRAEVDCILAAPPPEDPNSAQRNPDHEYLSAGTRAVKLTVKDNDGNIGSITKNLTVV